MPKRKVWTNSKYNRKRNRWMPEPSSSSLSSSSVSSESSITDVPTSVPNAFLPTDKNYGEFGLPYAMHEPFVPLRASTPVNFESGNSVEESNNSDPDDINGLMEEDKLYTRSNMSVSSFSRRLGALASKHVLTDAAVSDILDLLSEILPIPNKCPSHYKYQRILSTGDISKLEIHNCTDGEIFVMPFVEQVERILDKYPNIETLTTVGRRHQEYSDITSGHLFPQIDSKTLYFLLNTDGFSPILSRNLQVWPLLLSLINLPPWERRKVSNIVMAAFYIGKSKPQWDVLLKILIDKLTIQTFGKKKLKCCTVALVADAPAKSSVCYIQNTNAKFGCAACLVEGVYNSELHKMTFPIARRFTMRNADDHRRHQSLGTSHHPVFGVKGISPLTQILTLPVSVPYDSMHLIYLGIAKKLLHVVVHKKLVNVTSLSTFLSVVKVPHFFRRRPRNISSELCLWKAQEHKIFLLYLSLVSFYPFASSDIVHRINFLYLCLSSSVCALSQENVKEEILQSIEEIIFVFQQTMESTFGSGVCIGSFHSLIHLPQQVKNFGHLSATSAFSFENVNRVLKRSISGKVRQGRQIAERFLRLQKCTEVTARNSEVYPSGVEDPVVGFQTESLLKEVALFSSSLTFYRKVHANGKVFHSYNYGRRLQCASYFAFVANSVMFVKIKFICRNGDNTVCVCRIYDIVCQWHELLFPDMTENLRMHFEKISFHFKVRKNDSLQILSPESLSHHAIISKLDDGTYYAVKVINDHEHD